MWTAASLQVFYVTTSPPVADALVAAHLIALCIIIIPVAAGLMSVVMVYDRWHRTEINLLTKIASVTTSDEAGEEETKAGQVIKIPAFTTIGIQFIFRWCLCIVEQA